MQNNFFEKSKSSKNTETYLWQFNYTLIVSSDCYSTEKKKFCWFFGIYSLYMPGPGKHSTKYYFN